MLTKSATPAGDGYTQGTKHPHEAVAELVVVLTDHPPAQADAPDVALVTVA